MNAVKQVKLIEARKCMGLSRENAARRIQVSAASWVSYETGNRMPSLPVAFKMAKLLNVKVDDLFLCPDYYLK